MTNQHPITPPAGLVDKWSEEWHRSEDDNTSFEAWMLAHAAQWGADQELEACCMEIIDGAGRVYIDETRDRVRLADDIRAARRPNPPSLKKQALALLQPGEPRLFNSEMQDTLRRALEALSND